MQQLPPDGLRLRPGDQPLPIVNDREDIQTLLIADIAERREVGIQRYGTALQPFNGRSALKDAYDEALDLATYLKQIMVEEEENLLLFETYQDQVVKSGPSDQATLALEFTEKYSLVANALANMVLGKTDGVDWRTTFIYRAGDLLQSLAQICHDLGIELDKVAQTNIKKVQANEFDQMIHGKFDQVIHSTSQDLTGEMPPIGVYRDTFQYGPDPGQRLVGVHSESECEGRGCVVHHPSDHNMQDWPIAWRHGGPFDIKPPHFERVCEHGVGHPDPDDIAFWASRGEDIGVHGCDGCCRDEDECPSRGMPSNEEVRDAAHLGVRGDE